MNPSAANNIATPANTAGHGDSARKFRLSASIRPSDAVGGCVPMLLQIPFFIAYYKVLTVTIAMRGASWLWVNDLSQPETIAIRILPILLVVTQFLSQRMTPSPGADPSQQKMMMFMPLMFGAADLEAQAAMRRAFDPSGLANPFKVLPSPAACGDVQHVPDGAWI